MIQLRFCQVAYTDYGCRTTFLDGAFVDAIPHLTAHYHVISHRCGYGDDVLRYCREHEVCHSFLAERMDDATSDVLWDLAHDLPTPPQYAVTEEIAVQTFQRWLRANERPIVGGADWDGLKRDALGLLNNQLEKLK
jgi:hypothetical protein